MLLPSTKLSLCLQQHENPKPRISKSQCCITLPPFSPPIIIISLLRFHINFLRRLGLGLGHWKRFLHRCSSRGLGSWYRLRKALYPNRSALLLSLLRRQPPGKIGLRVIAIWRSG